MTSMYLDSNKQHLTDEIYEREHTDENGVMYCPFLRVQDEQWFDWLCNEGDFIIYRARGGTEEIRV